MNTNKRFNTLTVSVLVAMVLGHDTPLSVAQDAKKAAGAPAAPEVKAGATATATVTPATPETPKPTAGELEARFKATLTRATLSGRWCAVQDGKLGPDKEDKYTVLAVTKLGGDSWLVSARVQYGTADFVAPIPVQVKWAGDTPVITLDNVGLPGGKSYSARVLIYEKTYSGTWSGGDHGGLLHGVITNDQELALSLLTVSRGSLTVSAHGTICYVRRASGLPPLT